MRPLGPHPARPRSRRRTAAVPGALLALTSLVLAVAGVPAQAAPASPASVHALGARLDPVPRSAASGLQALRAATAGHLTAAALPAAVDLSPYAVAPGDQGPVGSCVAWAEAHTVAGWMGNVQRHVGAPFAPLYVYNQVNGGSDSGTSLGAAWRVLETQGVAEQSLWSQSHGTTDWRSQPTAAERANAANHRFGSHLTLFNGANQGAAAQTALQTALAASSPVVVVLPVYSAFDTLSPTRPTMTAAMATGTVLGYHAVAALGYDGTGIQVENSWGTRWGNRGWATLSWDFVQRYVSQADTTTGFLDGFVAPPVVNRVSRPVLSAAGDTLDVTVGRLDTVDLTAPSAVSLVSTADPAVTVAASAVARDASTLAVTTAAGAAPGTYRVVVTGRGGASTPSGTADLVTLVAPYAVSLVPGSVARTTGGTGVLLAGTGFGGSAAAFLANSVTAEYVVAGTRRLLQVAWVSDTVLKVVMPTGADGSSLAVTVRRNGVASAPVDVPFVAPVPVVTAPAVKLSTAGGASLTVAVSSLASVPSPTASLTLVSVAAPAVSVAAPVTARTAGTVTVRVPEAPRDDTGRPVQGAYRVVVTGSGGTSLPNGTADRVVYRTPLTASVPAGALVAPAGGTALVLTGTGFGRTYAEYAAAPVTAQVGTATGAVVWLDDTHLRLTVPVGRVGTTPSVVLVHDGVPGAAFGGFAYGALITASTAPTGSPAGGWTTTLSGAGFADSGSWALVDTAGTVLVPLPLVSGTAGLTAVGAGVAVLGDGSAAVKLPPAPGGVRGSYRLTFTPSASLYPGGAVAFTSRSVVSYSDLG